MEIFQGYYYIYLVSKLSSEAKLYAKIDKNYTSRIGGQYSSYNEMNAAFQAFISGEENVQLTYGTSQHLIFDNYVLSLSVNPLLDVLTLVYIDKHSKTVDISKTIIFNMGNPEDRDPSKFRIDSLAASKFFNSKFPNIDRSVFLTIIDRVGESSYCRIKDLVVRNDIFGYFPETLEG